MDYVNFYTTGVNGLCEQLAGLDLGVGCPDDEMQRVAAATSAALAVGGVLAAGVVRCLRGASSTRPAVAVTESVPRPPVDGDLNGRIDAGEKRLNEAAAAAAYELRAALIDINRPPEGGSQEGFLVFDPKAQLDRIQKAIAQCRWTIGALEGGTGLLLDPVPADKGAAAVPAVAQAGLSEESAAVDQDDQKPPLEDRVAIEYKAEMAIKGLFISTLTVQVAARQRFEAAIVDMFGVDDDGQPRTLSVDNAQEKLGELEAAVLEYRLASAASAVADMANQAVNKHSTLPSSDANDSDSGKGTA